MFLNLGKLYTSVKPRIEGLNWPHYTYPALDSIQRFLAMTTKSSYPLHQSENISPFFIIGPDRSGNTLLRRILGVHEDIYIPPESHILGPVIRDYRKNCFQSWESIVDLILSKFEYHELFDVWEISLRPLAQSLKKIPPEQRSLAFILHSLYCYHGQESGQTFQRWGDKTPINALWVNAILLVFPNALFIYMIRDGVDAISSRLEAGIGHGLEDAATTWKARVRVAESFLQRHPSKCLRVKYEALVSSPENETKKICAFLGLTFKPEMITSLRHAETLKDIQTYKHYSNVLKPIHNKSIGKGRQRLTLEQKKVLHRLIGTELELLGYKPAEVE